MQNPWLSISDFIEATHQLGQTVELCQPGVTTEQNIELGIPVQQGWKCRVLNGYAIAQNRSTVVSDAGALNQEDWRAYIFPVDFSPEDVTPSHRLRVNNTYYQLRLVQRHLQQGKDLMFEYQLQRTEAQIRPGL
jgi:hypothetical protein